MAMAAPTLHLRRVHWRPGFSKWGALSGVLAGVGGLIFQQQSGKLYPTATAAILAIAGGLLLPQVLVNIGRVVAVARANAKIGRAERVLAPRYGAAASPAPAPARTAVAGWKPTHTVPAQGLDAWSEPDAQAQPVASLDPGLQVQVTESRGVWAHILCDNGWTAWTDGRDLVALK